MLLNFIGYIYVNYIIRIVIIVIITSFYCIICIYAYYFLEISKYLSTRNGFLYALIYQQLEMFL